MSFVKLTHPVINFQLHLYCQRRQFSYDSHTNLLPRDKNLFRYSQWDKWILTLILISREYRYGGLKVISTVLNTDSNCLITNFVSPFRLSKKDHTWNVMDLILYFYIYFIAVYVLLLFFKSCTVPWM